MTKRIEVTSVIDDVRGQRFMETIRSKFPDLDPGDVRAVDSYMINADLSDEELRLVADMLTHPIIEQSSVGTPVISSDESSVVEIGFKPGVTDNVSKTVKAQIEERFGRKLSENESVHYSRTYHIQGLTQEQAQRIGESEGNVLINRIVSKSAEQFREEGGMDNVIPKVNLDDQVARFSEVRLAECDGQELVRTGKKGVVIRHEEIGPEEYYRLSEDADWLVAGDVLEEGGKFYRKVRNGTLALDLDSMKAIQERERQVGRPTTLSELELLAQTWSEHCKHTIFNASMDDDIPEGIFKRWIKGATDKILEERKKQGKDDFCISVFHDNAGGLLLKDEEGREYIFYYKVETHNSPSALDPYGGAITGIVGVFRDPAGSGLGTRIVSGQYDFRFADPKKTFDLYRGKDRTNPALAPRQLAEGVICGVKDGGNCSGNPTILGISQYDDRFAGKPLVFVGCGGIVERMVTGKPADVKTIDPGDEMIMIGGRVGLDGIHGATFSSEPMDEGSPATAVQIGDPITQKKMLDCHAKYAVPRGIVKAITDNGAGGLGSSCGETAELSGGAVLYLDQVPTKYPGMRPDQILISESQERMTVAVAPGDVEEYISLMAHHGVEATVIGRYTDNGQFLVLYKDRIVVDLDMNFLHDGQPEKHLSTTFTRQGHEEPEIERLEELTDTLHGMLSRLNICSKEFITTQFDHEVQDGSVIKPLQGKGRVNGDSSVFRPLSHSYRGIALTRADFFQYGDIDTADMAAANVDAVVRQLVAVGADPEKIALLDNFCWCSSDDPERLGQLKRAAKAFHDTAVAYATPPISGKDSMFNDFKGYDSRNNPVKISVPPTLLVTGVGMVDDVREDCVTMDAKFEDDIVYVIGKTEDELGGSEYLSMKGEAERGERYVGNKVPKVHTERNKQLYYRMHHAIKSKMVASAHSVGQGGLGVALARVAIAGKKGMDLDLSVLDRGENVDDDITALFSETQGRFVVTVAPEKAAEFERCMSGHASVSRLGIITDGEFTIRGLENGVIAETHVIDLDESYKKTLREY